MEFCKEEKEQQVACKEEEEEEKEKIVRGANDIGKREENLNYIGCIWFYDKVNRSERRKGCRIKSRGSRRLVSRITRTWCYHRKSFFRIHRGKRDELLQDSREFPTNDPCWLQERSKRKANVSPKSLIYYFRIGFLSKKSWEKDLKKIERRYEILLVFFEIYTKDKI